ncbi:MAG: hypothetical protein KGH75_00250 [Rhodospirillales bacterium]|nr:hypothetical protein [Rhodospirillales bacterium]
MSRDRLFTTPEAMTEREWQSTLQDRLTEEGYLWQHVYRMQTARGTWRTSTTSVGWPDLVALRGEHVLAIECKKSPRDLPTDDQIKWLVAFTALPTGRAWVLRPTDDWQAVANWIHQPWRSPEIHGWVRSGPVA